MTDGIDMNLPRVHPRFYVCQEAQMDVDRAIANTIKKHGLTTAEQLNVINGACSSWIGTIAKSAIRHERGGGPEPVGAR